MTKVVIIDDEVNARDSLKQLLNLYCPDVTVVGDADSVASGIECILSNNPDLVFLDIKMPDGTGFDLLSRIKKINFKIIFVTAYEEFALKAFKFNAIDYLTKPLEPEELVNAVSKGSTHSNDESVNESIKLLIENISKPSVPHKKIVLKTLNTIHVVEIDHIIRCESDRNYTAFHLVDQEHILISRSMREFEEMLEGYGFFRVHNSHLINLNFVSSFKKDELILVLKDNTTIPVAYRKRDELLSIIRSL